MSRSDHALFTVLIDNYNYRSFVGDAIESALSQTYQNVEVVVVDDGSTDGSREVIASFGNRIVAVFKENGGQTSAINAGLAASRGEWIHLLDSDDLFCKNKLERLAESIARYPSARMVAHDLAYCDDKGQAIEFAQPYIPKLTLVDDRQLARRGKLSVSLPAHSGLSMRRDLLESLSPLPEGIRMGIDNYLKWVSLSLAPVLVIPERLAKQRIHGGNAGTILAETGGKRARVRQAKQNATVTFNLKRDHPYLAKLAWKQYGRILYGLRSCRSEESRDIERDIRSTCSVFETLPSCVFYISAAFAKAYVEDLFGSKRRA